MWRKHCGVLITVPSKIPVQNKIAIIVRPCMPMRLYGSDNTLGLCHTVHSTFEICVQVLFSRFVGQIRQGRWFDPVAFDWPSQSAEVKSLLLNGKQTEPNYRQHAIQVLQDAVHQGCKVSLTTEAESSCLGSKMHSTIKTA